MKKILTLLFTTMLFAGVLLFPGKTIAQTFKIGGHLGSTNSRFVITLKSDFNFNDKLNELGFTITKKVPDGVKEIYTLVKTGIITDPFEQKFRNI